MDRPRTILFGYDQLLFASLNAVTELGASVEAVVFPSTRKDDNVAEIRRSIKARDTSILEQPAGNEIDDFVGSLQAMQPDLFLIWSYPMILPSQVIDIPPMGCVNVHPGLLPEYRGTNGLRWALLNGEDNTGVTMHFVDEGIDTGPMIARAAFPIEPEDDIRSLMIKSKYAGGQLITRFLPDVFAGMAITQPQDESMANYYSARMEPSATIDWDKSCKAIHNHIRAFAPPFRGARAYWNEHELVINSSELQSEATDAAAGTVLEIVENGLLVAVKDGTLLIKNVQIDGDGFSPKLCDALCLVDGQTLS